MPTTSPLDTTGREIGLGILTFLLVLGFIEKGFEENRPLKTGTETVTVLALECQPKRVCDGNPTAADLIPNHFAIITATRSWAVFRSEHYGDQYAEISKRAYDRLKLGQVLKTDFVERKNGSVDHEWSDGDSSVSW